MRSVVKGNRCRMAVHFLLMFFVMTMLASAFAADEVNVQQGVLQGIAGLDPIVRVFKGIPYAAPPVGDLRWKAPQPAPAWKGVRKADTFGPRCMQPALFSDMKFRDTMSEDCLYLNIWTPAKSEKEKLPVMVWIHGGGFAAGSASEPRQDGENLAKKGVVVVGVNYRLGVFGFLAHPELTKESPQKASGNYGLLDQVTALQWVHNNIAAFGGDPDRVTIFGESAGSMSVSALMGSPLAKGLIHRAIGESGGFGGRPMATLEQGEKRGLQFADKAGAKSIAELRAKSADELISVSGRNLLFPIVDGYFLSESLDNIFAQGTQNKVPLLAGWNFDENKGAVLIAKEKPTVKVFSESAKKTFGDKSDKFLKLYPAASDTEAMRSAMDLAGDSFIGFSTWNWIERHLANGNSPVYRFSFDQVPLSAPGATINGIPLREFGARHSGEIEYVFASFPLTGVDWEDEDRKLSDLMMTYWSNFARTGNPNGPGLPKWPTYSADSKYPVMHFVGSESGAKPDANRGRYQFLDANREWMQPGD